MEQILRTVTDSMSLDSSADTVATLIGSAQTTLSSLGKRDFVAFKAGTWAGVPMEIAFEKVVMPQIKKRFGEKAFYRRISQFGKSKGSTSIKGGNSSSKFNFKRYNSKMPAKRSYRNANLEKRLNRIESMAKSEMKSITYSTSGTVTTGTIDVLNITGMSPGTGVNNRIGDRIKVWRVEIRGQMDNELDGYLIQKHGTDNPDYSDFGPNQGAFILDSTANNKFTCWSWVKNPCINSVTGAIIHRIQKFPMGIVISYEGVTVAPVDNGLLWCVRNTTSSDHARNLSIRVWYTDK